MTQSLSSLLAYKLVQNETTILILHIYIYIYIFAVLNLSQSFGSLLSVLYLIPGTDCLW